MSDPVLPQRARVVVVGGGVIGCSVAYHLAGEGWTDAVTEFHIVGGLHPSLPFSYYTDMLRALKAVHPDLQLKCFTAIEVLHLAWLAKKSVGQTLQELRDAGLDSLTGGGAEIFRTHGELVLGVRSSSRA